MSQVAESSKVRQLADAALSPRPYNSPHGCRRTNSAAGSYLWGAVLRLDVLHAPAATSLTFYGPPVLSVRAVPLLPAEAHAQLPVDPNVRPCRLPANHC